MNSMRKAVSIGLAHLAYAAYGLDVFGRYRWLLETEKWTPEQREKWKLDRLNYILDFTWKNVPFYRDFWSGHGLTWKPLGHVDELKAYPILRKAMFRKNWEKVRPGDWASIPHIAKSTGGSTGKPVHYLQDREQWALMQGFQFWGWSQTGYAFGDPVGVITGGSLMPNRVTIFERVRLFIERRLFLLGVHMDRKLAIEYHRRLTDYGAEFLYGYPSILFMFCRHLAEEGLQLPKIRAVVTTAEMMLPHYRLGIESALKCKVFDDYGCNDGGFESFECREHRGMHYNEFQSLLETETGKANAGTLLITNYWNRTTPFIRYENGDRVTLAKTACPCGTKFPLIESVDGRTGDILQFANGQCFVCPPHLFSNMDIEGWQVVQTTPSKVEVRLAKAGGIDQNYIAKIQDVMRYHLDDSIEIEVKHVQQLTVTAAGKMKPVWSEVKSSSANDKPRS